MLSWKTSTLSTALDSKSGQTLYCAIAKDFYNRALRKGKVYKDQKNPLEDLCEKQMLEKLFSSLILLLFTSLKVYETD